MPKTELCGNRNIAQCQRLNTRAFLAVTCAFLSCTQRERWKLCTKALLTHTPPQHTHTAAPLRSHAHTHSEIHALLVCTDTATLTATRSAHTHSHPLMKWMRDAQAPHRHRSPRTALNKRSPLSRSPTSPPAFPGSGSPHTGAATRSHAATQASARTQDAPQIAEP